MTASARPRLALLAAVFSIAAGAAGPNESPSPRFVPVEIYLESPQPVAAWQFELADRARAMTVVGIEGGGHEAFAPAPYHDRGALARGGASRIVVADYSLAGEHRLPAGRVHLATVHLMLEGDPDFALRLVTAATATGKPIEASIALGDFPTHTEETSP